MAAIMVPGLIAIFCFARGVSDWKAGRRRWGIAGFIAAIAILITPVQPVTVTVPLLLPGP